MKHFLLFFSLFQTLSLLAQPFFTQRNEIPVYQNNTLISLSWVGGFNAPQFQEFDLNKDQYMDLLIFDREDERFTGFVNNPYLSPINYTFKPAYQDSFPPIKNWFLTRDLNGDGKRDIITSNNGKVSFYQYNTNSGFIDFTLKDTLKSTRGSSLLIKIYVSNTDIPAIDDIDNDGDLDILTFGVAGSKVEFIENIGTPTEYKFNLRERCWGKFTENFSNNSVTLNDCPNQAAGIRHAGSTLTTFDLDGDSDKELFLGDITFNNITMLKNTPNSDGDFMTFQDNNYPTNNIPVDVQLFPSTYFIDIDNDGLKDMINAPNATNNINTSESAWLYKNVGNSSQADFQFTQKDFLQSNMIDIGKFSKPYLVDYDGDFDYDLFVGAGEYLDGNTIKSSIFYYENIGTPYNPIFNLVTKDFGNILSLNIGNHLSPTIEDYDLDGDKDMIIGTQDGKLYYFNNNNNNSFNYVSTYFNNIDVGFEAAPTAFDIDNDNDLDLIVGERDGNLNFYENTGNYSNPNFVFKTDSFGKVNVINDFGVGNSSPQFTTYDNETYLHCGSGYLGTKVFKINPLDLNEDFTEVNIQNFNKIRHASPAIKDLQNDGKPDLIIGNIKGGLEFFRGVNENQITVAKNNLEVDFNLYPNPSKNTVFIKSTNNWKSYSLNDIQGKILLAGTKTESINISSLKPGIYYLNILTEEKNKLVKKIIKI